jgi:hypothetical protein
MPLWRKLLVVLPAFVILHLVATSAALLSAGLRELWQPAGFDEAWLLAGFPAGYAMGAALGLSMPPGTARPVLSLALLLSMGGLYGFGELANGYMGGTYALLTCGFAAGMALPVVARCLGLAGHALGGVLMAILTGLCWWVSLPFFDFFKQGLPISGTPGWAAPFYVQGAFCLLWLPQVVLLAAERPGGKRR